jgi:hypothetical protein
MKLFLDGIKETTSMEIVDEGKKLRFDIDASSIPHGTVFSGRFTNGWIAKDVSGTSFFMKCSWNGHDAVFLCIDGPKAGNVYSAGYSTVVENYQAREAKLTLKAPRVIEVRETPMSPAAAWRIFRTPTP